MGNNIDKMDPVLKQFAPLNDEIIKDIYFIHDAYRYMDMISLACESIIRPSNTNDNRNRISSLQDLGLILKASGRMLGKTSTFARILIAVGELEILLGKMENNWAFNIEDQLVKPIQRCINQHADEITTLRDQIMRLRLQIRDCKTGVNSNSSLAIFERDFLVKQEELKIRLQQEKRSIAEMKRNITKVLESQMDMNQNSSIHLETLVETLKKNPKKIQIQQDDSSGDELIEGRLKASVTSTPNCNPNSVTCASIVQTPAMPQVESCHSQMDLPEFTKSTTKSKNIFARFISKKLSSQKLEKEEKK